MKTILLLTCLVLVSHASVFSFNARRQWEEFKATHKRAYGSDDEHEFRFKIFIENLRKIVKHNREYNEGKHSYTMGINQYSDLLHTEFADLMLKNSKRMNDNLVVRESLPKADAPDTMDWRSKGAVTPIKDQSACGGCWAFSATGSIEGANFVKNGKLVSVSEQQLIDCSTDYENNGCGGGLEYNGFQYLIDIGGIETEEAYPYEAKDAECRFDKSAVSVKISSFKHLKQNDEDELLNAVATIGPISIGIDASNFQHYKDGIFVDDDCSSDFNSLNHSVLAVGYGSEDGQDYWLVKNSWGESWGEQGYIKMARNHNNMCGVASDASYPIV